MMGKKRWTKRSSASGKFMSQKKAGAKKYKGRSARSLTINGSVFLRILP
jgi:hypothetical protein